MSLSFNFLRRKKSTKENNSLKIDKNTYKKFLIKTIGLISNYNANRGEFSEPEHDLEEIKIASEADSYIKMALSKYKYLLFKSGYDLKSNNDEAIKYLKTRLKLMGFSTQKPMDILFQEIGDDLVTFSNAFLVKTRVDVIMPGIKATGIFNDKPIGGYFRVDPITIKIKRDKFGKILKYQQKVEGGDTKEFMPTEVIHFYLDKDANNAFGTPRISAALEDVKLLRRIEGNVLSLIYRFAIPIYQWMIGLPEKGFMATDPEVENARREIENMSLDGIIITNERTQIKAIGAEGVALDASNYLQYFEKRVFTALGVSETQMGRGGAKQDADSMEQQMHDAVKHIQSVMSIFIENFMLVELLLEGGFNPLFDDDDEVSFIFNEISLDTKIKLENHEMLKYQSNLSTFDEARHAVGKKSNVDDNELYINKIENKAAIDQINAKTDGAIQLAKTNTQVNPKPVGGVAGNGKSKNTKNNKDVTNRNRPQNQYGTHSAKIKEDFNLEEKKNRLNTKKSFVNIYNKYKNLCNDIRESDSDIDILLALGCDSICNEITKLIKESSFDGISKAVSDIREIKPNQNFDLYINHTSNIILSIFIDEAKDTIKGIIKDIKKRVKSTDRKSQDISIIFNSLQYRIRFLLEFILPKVYWYSYIKTLNKYGIKKAYIEFDGSEDEKIYPHEIDTMNFSIDNIPAYHSFCNCKVYIKAGEEYGN